MSAEGAWAIMTYFRVCDGVRVRCADTKADSDTTVMMLAPSPESRWAFRRIWGRVTPSWRVVAIDMPGFGHSDQRRSELIAPGAMEASLDGPDVRAAAALTLAARVPDRVTSLTVGGGAVRRPIDAAGALNDVIGAPSLDDLRQWDARVNIGYAVELAAGRDIEPEVHEDYVMGRGAGGIRPSGRRVDRERRQVSCQLAHLISPLPSREVWWS